MRKIILIFICLLVLCPSAYSKMKNLYNMVEGKTVKVYLGDFSSDTEKVNPQDLNNLLKDMLVARKKESFSIAQDKQSSNIVINGKILSYRYLEKDPVDHVVGGTYGLVVDALVVQNYAQVQIEFTVISPVDGRRLWQDKITSSVTESNMPEPDSIPKVLKECSKRFIFLCFGKPKR